MSGPKGGIASFFEDKTVLVTGATGFLGAVLVEKLLRSCPKVKRIYVLIRKKKGDSAQKRLARILSLPLFESLGPDSKSKVTSVEGDVALEDGGLSQYDKKKVLGETQVVFHVAAYINFNAALARAVRINVQGTSHILDLAKRMPNIRVFVYTSTAYCNCTQRNVVDEKVYPSKWRPRDIINLLDTTTAEELLRKQSSILGEFPNAYVFTKLLAENLILSERGDLPVVIVRPTIVMGTMTNPLPGWVDNVNNGATAFIAGAGRGVFRTIHGDGCKVADIVPCDQFANLMVAAAWDVSNSRGLKVYHHSSGYDNPLTWRDYCYLIIKATGKYPCTGLVLLPRAKIRSSKLRNDIQSLFAHYLPAFILDMGTSLMGKKPVLVDIQKRYFKGMQYTSFFTFRQWVFDKKHAHELSSKLESGEKDEFDFDTSNIDWPSYMEKCVLGVRRYFHKEPDSNLPVAMFVHRIWRIVDVAFHAFMTILFFIFFYSLTGHVSFSSSLAVLVLLLYVWF